MPETLATHRCPVCTWTGVDEAICPDCGHGTVDWELTLHD